MQLVLHYVSGVAESILLLLACTEVPGQGVCIVRKIICSALFPENFYIEVSYQELRMCFRFVTQS